MSRRRRRRRRRRGRRKRRKRRRGRKRGRRRGRKRGRGRRRRSRRRRRRRRRSPPPGPTWSILSFWCVVVAPASFRTDLCLHRFIQIPHHHCFLQPRHTVPAFSEDFLKRNDVETEQALRDIANRVKDLMIQSQERSISISKVLNSQS